MREQVVSVRVSRDVRVGLSPATARIGPLSVHERVLRRRAGKSQSLARSCLPSPALVYSMYADHLAADSMELGCC